MIFVDENNITYENAIASNISYEEQLRRTVMAAILWEDNFYEDGITVSNRIKDLIGKVDKETALNILFEAKFENKLRHIPLFMIVHMLKYNYICSEDIVKVITRADDILELLSLYINENGRKLNNQLKKALSKALNKFDEYHFSKYTRKSNKIKFGDVIKLVHPKPSSKEQSDLWKRIIENKLKSPDTWEVNLSTKTDDTKTVFTRLIKENKLGDLAFLRNLRLMLINGVDEELIRNEIVNRKWDKILPHQFIIAYNKTISFKEELELSLFKSLSGFKKIPGKTAILVDKSLSMGSTLSKNSEITRYSVACGLSIMSKEVCEDADVFTFNDRLCYVIKKHRGFDLLQALGAPKGGTCLGKAIKDLSKHGHYDNIIIVTDEQSEDTPDFNAVNAKNVFIVNVGVYDKGISYENEKVVHINGWSENTVTYITKYVCNKTN